MRMYVASVTLAALLPATSAFAAETGEVVVKCRRSVSGNAVPAPVARAGAEAEQPPARLVLQQAAPAPAVYVVDGTVVGQSDFDAVDRAEMESISVVCSDERHRVFGVEPGRDLVVVYTRPGRYSALTASMRSLAALQEAHLARNGVFASRLEDLRWSDPSGSVTVKLSVSEDGGRWTATGTHRHLSATRAVSVSGEKPPLSAVPGT